MSKLVEFELGLRRSGGFASATSLWPCLVSLQVTCPVALTTINIQLCTQVFWYKNGS